MFNLHLYGSITHNARRDNMDVKIGIYYERINHNMGNKRASFTY